jgi:outer membrane protein assembly factor BamB
MRQTYSAIGYPIFFFGLASLFVPVSTTRAAPPALPSWALWRGPSGQGYSDDTRVPLTWSDQHNLLWKTDLPGKGNSTPILWGDHIFLTAASPDGKDRYVVCVQARDGKVLWQELAARETYPGRSHDWNGYASPSCATDGTYVYAFLGESGLFCYDFTGKLIWKHPFGILTYEATLPFGPASSPFLFKDLVIQLCDHDGPNGVLPAGRDPTELAPSALIALDKRTGQVRWQTPRDQGKSSSTPLLLKMPDGRLDLIVNSPQGVWAYDPRTGKEIWHCDRKGDTAKFGEQMPLSNRDTLFIASGRPNGPMQAIRLGGTGDVSKTHLLWQVIRKSARDISSHLLWGDYLYAADWQGVLSCYDIHDGRMVYPEKQRIGTSSVASPIAVRDKILFVMDNGETVVLEPGREFKVAGRNRLSDSTPFRASPAIADGRLYLRSQSHLYCIGAH